MVRHVFQGLYKTCYPNVSGWRSLWLVEQSLKKIDDFLLAAIAMNTVILFYLGNTELSITGKYNGTGFHLHNLSRSRRLKFGSTCKPGNGVFPTWKGNSVNSANSWNLINHQSMN